jgi:muramoyltetrapeptide carboxypeptidase
VRPGDRLAIVAPASPFDVDRFERGVARLRERYAVVFDESIRSRAGFLAGDDARRRSELAAALADPATRAIVAVRGGYGAMRLLSSFEPAEIARAPKWLVGFSDVTALHALWARAGLQSMHGPMVAKLADASASDFEAWCACLEGADLPELRGTGLAPGRARGPLAGGNLAVFSALLGTPHLPAIDGAVLLLEDVGERPYRLDRMLTSLRDAGVFDRVRAVIVGELLDCEPGSDGTTAMDVIAERIAGLGIPVIAGVPIGHGALNQPVRLGAIVSVEGDAGVVSFS